MASRPLLSRPAAVSFVRHAPLEACICGLSPGVHRPHRTPSVAPCGTLPAPLRALFFFSGVAQGAHGAVPAVPELEKGKGDRVGIDGSRR